LFVLVEHVHSFSHVETRNVLEGNLGNAVFEDHCSRVSGHTGRLVDAGAARADKVLKHAKGALEVVANEVSSIFSSVLVVISVVLEVFLALLDVPKPLLLIVVVLISVPDLADLVVIALIVAVLHPAGVTILVGLALRPLAIPLGCACVLRMVFLVVIGIVFVDTGLVVVHSIAEEVRLEPIVPELVVVVEILARLPAAFSIGKLASGELGVAGVEAELDVGLAWAEVVLIGY